MISCEFNTYEKDLENRLYTILQGNDGKSKFDEELKLFTATLVFLFSTQSVHLPNGSRLSSDYSSRSRNSRYTIPKRSLYMINIMSVYLFSRLRNNLTLPSRPLWMIKFSTLSSFTLKFFKLLAMVLHIASPAKHQITSVVNLLYDIPTFICETASFQYGNDNTIMRSSELLLMNEHNNETFRSSLFGLMHGVMLSKISLSMTKSAQVLSCVHSTRNEKMAGRSVLPTCLQCGEFPTNPHMLNCCKKVLCYICGLKITDRSRCIMCRAVGRPMILPLY